MHIGYYHKRSGYFLPISKGGIQRLSNTWLPNFKTAGRETLMLHMMNHPLRTTPLHPGALPRLRPEDAGLRIRVVTFGDAGRGIRSKWLRDAVGNFEDFTYREDDYKFLSTADSDFDVLVISANDFRRVAKFVRSLTELTRSKVKICICDNSSPRDRAAVISAGCDDAIDISKVSSLEMLARLAAMAARYRASGEQLAEDSARDLQVDSLVDPAQRLNKKQKAVLDAMSRKAGHVTTHDALQSLISCSWEPASYGSTKVFISNLRKKLATGVRIKAAKGQGYILNTGS